MHKVHLLHSAKYAFVASVLMLAFGMLSFFSFEPSVSRAMTSQFTITQQITNEISWVLQPTNVTMTGSIAGLTGGNATGTTVAVVNTNNATGYNMTINFADGGSGKAMQASSTAYINDYTPAGGSPDYSWVQPATGGAAVFGYTVKGSTAGEVASAFKNDGSACGTGSSETANTCWQAPTTGVARTIMNSSAPNTSSTSTITFKVAVPANSNPQLPSAYYVATATLTATTNS